MQFRFDSFAEFLSMAGHGPYVWACYFAAVLALGYIILAPISRRQSIQTQLLRQEKIAEQQLAMQNNDSNA